jgi:hypothetical protein
MAPDQDAKKGKDTYRLGRLPPQPSAQYRLDSHISISRILIHAIEPTLVFSAFPDQSIDVLGDFLNFPPRRLVMDRLFHSLIYLFGRE